MLNYLVTDSKLKFIFELEVKSVPLFPKRLIPFYLLTLLVIYFNSVLWRIRLTIQVCIGELKVNKINSFRNIIVNFFCLMMLSWLCQKLVVINCISQLELNKAYSFEMPAKYFVVIQHKQFSFNRKLFVELLFIFFTLPCIVDLLNFIFFIADLKIDLF